jgi:hypothetical protein
MHDDDESLFELVPASHLHLARVGTSNFNIQRFCETVQRECPNSEGSDRDGIVSGIFGCRKHETVQRFRSNAVLRIRLL